MDKDGRIPTSLESAWTTVKAFGRFVKQQVSTGQNDFMGVFGAGAGTESAVSIPTKISHLFPKSKLKQ
jgi:hypothetical protein